MNVILLSLPDLKTMHARLTVNATYRVLDRIGNGYVIETDDEDDEKRERVVVLASRFAEVKQ